MFIKKISPKSFSRGFSLLELLMVMTLAPIVFFSVYSNFSAGLRIWSAVVRPTPEEDVNIFFYKTRRDLENMMRVVTIPFTGDKEEVVFAAGIETVPVLGGPRGLGQVRFYYDDSSNTVRREVKNLSELYRDSEGQQTVLMKNVSSFEISYLAFNRLDNEAVWTDSWKPEAGMLPLAVRLSLSMEKDLEKKERIFFIPVGGFVPK